MRKFISYMITDPAYSLEEIFNAIKNKSPDFVCYRNKLYYDEKEIIEFAEFAKNYAKVFINYDSVKNENILDLFDGVHLPTSKIDMIDKFEQKTVIASTHTKEEILNAKKADYVTFSPVFESKQRPGVGIEKLNEMCELYNNVIALGGITTHREIEEIKRSKAVGFASIRYFFT